jgi:OOP family OmpA-OmpF porin
MKKTLVCISLALLGAQALAADSGWYVGGDIGSSKFKAEGDTERKTGFGAFGGYSLNPNVAFEAQVRRLGSWDVEGTDVSANSLSLSVLAKAPISQQFSLYGRLGVARNSVDVSEGNYSASAHKTKALIGFGAEYLISKEFNLRAEFVNLGNNKIGSGAEAVSIKIQQFNFGLSYAF